MTKRNGSRAMAKEEAEEAPGSLPPRAGGGKEFGKAPIARTSCSFDVMRRDDSACESRRTPRAPDD